MSGQEVATKVLELLRNIASALAPRSVIRIAHADSTGWRKELRVSARPCRFRAAVVSNKHATDAVWLWVFDNTEQVATPTCAPLYVPALTSQALDWTDSPREMRVGIFLAVSTDPATFTAPSANDYFFECAYDLETLTGISDAAAAIRGG